MTDSAPESTGLRDRLIAVARKRFQKFGFRRTGMAEIARDAGIAAGTLYRYFKDKEDLFRAILGAEHETWSEIARQILAEPGSASERLKKLSHASVRFHQEHVLTASILSNDSEMIQPAMMQELQEKLRDGTVGPMADVIRDGIRSGEFRDLDPTQTARVLFLCGQALFQRGGDDYPKLIRVFGELTREGLHRPAAPKRHRGNR
jgi:AcrR family transcriptional regulator